MSKTSSSIRTGLDSKISNKKHLNCFFTHTYLIESIKKPSLTNLFSCYKYYSQLSHCRIYQWGFGGFSSFGICLVFLMKFVQKCLSLIVRIGSIFYFEHRFPLQFHLQLAWTLFKIIYTIFFPKIEIYSKRTLEQSSLLT